jgi:hypothetical protein
LTAPLLPQAIIATHIESFPKLTVSTVGKVLEVDSVLGHFARCSYLSCPIGSIRNPAELGYLGSVINKQQGQGSQCVDLGCSAFWPMEASNQRN